MPKTSGQDGLLAHQQDSVAADEACRAGTPGMNGSRLDHSLLFEKSTEGMLIAAEDGDVLDANPEARRLLGVAADGGLRELFDPSDPRLASAWEEYERTGRHKGELRLARGSGETFEGEVSMAALGEGKVGIVVRELPGREQAGAWDTVEEYRAIFEGAPEGIYQTTIEGSLQTANPEMARILGYESPKELIENLTDVRNQLYLDPESRDEFEALLRDRDVASGFETRVRRKDGSVIWIRVNARALLDPDGGLRGYGGTFVDITERREADQKLRRSMDALLAVYEASHALSSALDLEEIGARLLRIMRRTSDLTAAAISLPDEDRRPRVWRAVGLENLARKARYAPQAWDSLRAVLGSGEQRSFHLEDDRPGTAPLVGLHLPLRTRDRTIGVLEVYGPEALREKEMVELLSSLSSKAASALESARLYEELSEREQRLQDLVGRLLAAQEEERQRVAYDVHDGLTQMLVASYQRLQTLADHYPPESSRGRAMIHQVVEIVRGTIGEARRVIADLRPTALDDFGLATAIRLFVEKLRDEGWQVGYRENLSGERLPDAVETALYRVAQEALSNVRKHSRSDRVRVELGYAGRNVRLRVRDWGSGLGNVPQPGDGAGEHVGLSSMRERVALVGGKARILTSEGVGTLVVASVPLDGGGATGGVARAPAREEGEPGARAF